MRSNYKKLGPYIREVSEKNKDLQVEKLLGVSITKAFIPSIANVIGTDMSKYKIVRTNQFAYGPVTSRNGEKISVALLDQSDCIISTSYTVFEIIDHEALDPEYLMMWFRRPEFDRYARYMSHGSVREIFGWGEMCDVELPIPSIEKQREIVREYNTIVNRIALNEQLTQKLEETAQAIYKHWFVDFEFPITAEYATAIGKPDLEEKPYKSSGGKMVFCEELDQEIPKDWESSLYEKAIHFKTGKLNSNAACENGQYPFFTCSADTFLTNTYSFDCEAVILAGNNASAIYPLKYYRGKFDAYQRTYIATPKHPRLSNPQIYFSIKNELEGFKGSSSGTATKFLTMKILDCLTIIIAEEKNAKEFSRIMETHFSYKLIIEKESIELEKFKNIILSKMSITSNEESIAA